MLTAFKLKEGGKTKSCVNYKAILLYYTSTLFDVDFRASKVPTPMKILAYLRIPRSSFPAEALEPNA